MYVDRTDEVASDARPLFRYYALTRETDDLDATWRN